MNSEGVFSGRLPLNLIKTLHNLLKNDQKNRIFFHFPLEAIFFIPTKVTSKYFVIALD